MSMAIARDWLKRLYSAWYFSSQLRSSVETTVPVRMRDFMSAPDSPVMRATASCSATWISAMGGTGTHGGRSWSSTWSSRT